MIADALSGKFDLILTKEVSRFARNTVDTLSYTRKLKEVGVGVVFTIDHIDTRNSDGELRLTIMASIAQEESRKTSERVKWGQKRRMEQGVVFGRELLGYTVKNGHLSVKEEEVPVVRAIFHKYTNEGKGANTIGKELLREGYQPKGRTQWSGTAILRILRNEKYVGDLCQKKTYTPNYLTHEKKKNRGAEEKIYLSNHHQPIIDRDLWNRTQEELQRRTVCHEEKERYSRRYWCSGKIYCGECGSRFVSRTKSTAGGTYQAWRCYQAARHGSLKRTAEGELVGCSNCSVNEKVLLYCIKYGVGLILKNQEKQWENVKRRIYSQLEKAGREGDNMEGGVFNANKIKQKIEWMEEKKKRALDAMLEELLTKDELKKQMDWYNREIDFLHLQLRKQMKEHRQQEGRKRHSGTIEKALLDIVSYEEKNGILNREIVEKIVIYREQETRCCRIVIWFLHLSFGICMRVRSEGRADNYQVIVENTKFIPRQECEHII